VLRRIKLIRKVMEAYAQGMGKKWADIEKRLKEGEFKFLL
jgi:hypothetical protein